MSAAVEFDGDYGRTGRIEIKVAECCACKVNGPCLVADQSEGEYSPAVICLGCISKLFGATQPQAPQGAVTGWQPIETAPKDEEIWIAALGVYGDVPATIRWIEGDWDDGWGTDVVRPTHWMPLPAAPETPEGRS